MFIQEADVKWLKDDNNPLYEDMTIIPMSVDDIGSKRRIVVLISKDTLPKVRVRRDLMSTGFASIWLEYTDDLGDTLLMGGFYREWGEAGNYSRERQLKRLSVFMEQIQRASKLSRKVIVIGDGNIDRNRWFDSDYEVRKAAIIWDTIIEELNLTFHDIGNTFLQKREGDTIYESALDHIITSDLLTGCDPKKVENGLSDHVPILVEIPMGKIKRDNEELRYVLERNFKKMDHGQFHAHMAGNDWTKLNSMSTSTEMVECLDAFYTTAKDIFAPQRIQKHSSKFRTDLSDETILQMKERDLLKREIAKVKRSGATKKAVRESWEKYKRSRNKTTRCARRDVRDSLTKKIMNNKDDARVLWKIVKDASKTSTKESLRLKEDGHEIKDEKMAANIMNKHFIDKIDGIKRRIDQTRVKDPYFHLRKPLHRPKMELHTVSEDTVVMKIKALKNKKSSGFDEITSELIKKGEKYLKGPLTAIINRSIESGEFPQGWKLSRICPVHKKGDKSDKNNYRPVALLSVFSKILERVVLDQLEIYCTEHGLIPSNQHGFRKNHSTTSAIIASAALWMESIQKGLMVGMVNFDLSAAFDCISSRILLEKMELMGFGPKCLKWIKSFLEGRKQIVKVGEALSDPLDLMHGSQQGGCLSPFLFLLYVSDMPEWISEDIGTISSFADDTSGLVTGKTRDELLMKVSKMAEILLNYMASNGLCANETKTELLLFGGAGGAEAMVGGSRIRETDNVKYLGMIISRSQTWKAHTDAMMSKLRSKIGLLNKLMAIIPKQNLPEIVQAQFISLIRYGLPVYGTPRMTEADPESKSASEIRVFVNDLMRKILGVPRIDGIKIQTMMEKTGIPSINQVTVEVIMMEMWRSMKFNLQYSADRQLLQRDVDGHRSEGTRRAIVPMLKKSISKDNIQWKFGNVWNRTPQGFRDCDDLEDAKEKALRFSTTCPV